jgi:hypothetical protein
MEILVNFNATSFNLNETKSFKLIILSVISYLIRVLNDQKDTGEVIQTLTKLLANLLFA